MVRADSLKAGLLGPGSGLDPYPAYARLRREEPVRRIRLREGLWCWLISRYDDARAAKPTPG